MNVLFGQFGGSHFGTGPPVIFMILFVVIFTIAIARILLKAGLGAAEWASNNAQSETRVEARVVSKRTEISGSRQSTSTGYYITFELPSGDRNELEVSGEEYGQLSEGDTGLLTHQGTRYLGFTREPRHVEPPPPAPQVPKSLVCAYCGNAIPNGKIKCETCGWTWKPTSAVSTDQ